MKASFSILIPNIKANIEIAAIGNISATALLPQGLGIRKRGTETSAMTSSMIVNHPKAFSDDPINAGPIKRREKETMKKDAIEKYVCRTPVVSGNMPIPIRAHAPRKRNTVPTRPNCVSNISLFLRPITKHIPRIPATMSPKLNKIETMPREAHIDFSPGIPPKSLSQLSVQLNHGE